MQFIANAFGTFEMPKKGFWNMTLVANNSRGFSGN